MDLVNNVAHVGHSNKKVQQVVVDQLAKLNTNTRYLQKSHEEYIEALLSLFPAPLDVVFLTTSGSEANDLAIRIAKTVTGNTNVICFDHAYHGNTQACIDVSPLKFNGKGGAGKPDLTQVVNLDLFMEEATENMETTSKSKSKSTSQSISSPVGLQEAQLPLQPGEKASIDDILRACETIKSRGGGLAAVIVEPILGCGGQIPLSKPILEASLENAHKNGGLLIVDEVQTGFYRSISHPWAFQAVTGYPRYPDGGVCVCPKNEAAEYFVPDIVTLGKPIGNGWAMGAVVTTREIADKFSNGMEYFSTFGGSSVSCRVGLGVLEETHRILPHAKEVSEVLAEGFFQLLAQFPSVLKGVTGIGLFLGLYIPMAQSTPQEGALDFGALVGPFTSYLKCAVESHESTVDSTTSVESLEILLKKGLNPIDLSKYLRRVSETEPFTKQDEMKRYVLQILRDIVVQTEGMFKYDVVREGGVVGNETEWVALFCRENGVLISTDGPKNDMLKVKPPMVLSKGSVEKVLQTLKASFMFISLIRSSRYWMVGDLCEQ